MKPHFIRTDQGEELVVLTHREYLALRAQAGEEDAEDEMTTIIAAERQADLDAGRDHILPGWFTEAAMAGKGSVLRGIREYRGMSMADVAAAAGVSAAGYGDVERGTAVPTVDVLDRISAALDLDPRWMRSLERNRIVGA